MLRILGSTRKLCSGMSRRDLLRVGGLGLAGLSLPQILALQERSAAAETLAGPATRPASFGKAKSVILIHLYGAPSQLEWVDCKPDAPVEIRGELGVIPSTLPECPVCELFPKMAQVMDRTTVLRSLTHPYPIHGVAFALTGVPAIDVAMELAPHDPRHWPYFGSVVEYVDALAREGRPVDSNSVPRGPAVPGNIALPFRFSSQRVGEVNRAGPYAAFLGSQFDPLWADFQGKATRGITKTLQKMTFTDPDPYVEIAGDSYFVVPNASALQPELSLDRLDRRKSLLAQFNGALPGLIDSSAGRALTKHQQSALSLLESPQLSEALDLRRESAETRSLYGSSLFGQSCLAARRLVEAGSRVVSVFWDEFGLAGSGWDTHWNHYPRMKEELAPGFDVGWYGLITDLDRRGLLDDVLVVCTSEHGRTPKITSGGGGGRDHWSRAYSSLLAGAGIARGKVVGATDKHAGDVIDRPVSPKDLLATMYHLLGIDPHLLIADRQGRPLPLVDAAVIGDVLA